MIQKLCNFQTCSFEIVEADIDVTTNFLGKESVHIIKSKPITTKAIDLRWDIPAIADDKARFASVEQMSGARLPACEGGVCDFDKNPTGVFFDASRDYVVSIVGSITLPNGNVVDINDSTDVSISEFPTQVTYNMPNGSTITATDAAAAFAASTSKLQDNVGQVIGSGGTNGTLTFICKDGYFVDPIAVDLADGNSQTRFSWTQIVTEAPTPVFNGTNWESIGITISAVNNEILPLPTGNDWATGIDCGLPI